MNDGRCESLANVHYESEGGIFYVTLNRIKRKKQLNIKMEKYILTESTKASWDFMLFSSWQLSIYHFCSSQTSYFPVLLLLLKIYFSYFSMFYFYHFHSIVHNAWINRQRKGKPLNKTNCELKSYGGRWILWEYEWRVWVLALLLLRWREWVCAKSQSWMKHVKSKMKGR